MNRETNRTRRWLIAVIVTLSIIIVAVSGGIIYYMYNNGDDYDKGNVGNGKNLEDEVNSASQRKNNSEIIQLSPGGAFIVGLRADGTAVAEGYNEGESIDVEDWKDIKKVSASVYYAVGLKNDGTVVVAGDNGDDMYKVGALENIVDIFATKHGIIGLNEKSELVGAYDNQLIILETNVDNVYVGEDIVVGKKKDGSVFVLPFVSSEYTDEERVVNTVEQWDDIVSYAIGNCYVAGLKGDGTVMAVTSSKFLKQDVESWKNIKAIYASEYTLFGITVDGDVVATNVPDEVEKKLESWTNMKKIFINSNTDRFPVVGLKNDGTVVLLYDKVEGVCFDIDGWTDIVDVVASYAQLVGIKKDGTFVYTGIEEYNVEHWNK